MDALGLIQHDCIPVEVLREGAFYEAGLDLVEELRPLVPDGYSMAGFAQRFLLDFPEVTTIITGASRPSQVTENAGVSGLSPLAPDIHERLASFYHEKVTQHIRGKQ